MTSVAGVRKYSSAGTDWAAWCLGRWASGSVTSSPPRNWDIPCGVHKKRRELRMTNWEARLPNVVLPAGGLL